MFQLIAPNFFTANAKTKNLLQRMSRFDLDDRLELVGNAFESFGFRSSFTLSDQVLTHALIKARMKVEFVVDLDAQKSADTLLTLKHITRETYGVDFKQRFSSNIDAVLTSNISEAYTSTDKVRSLVAINPLAGFTQKQLVEYVLAHEVPVDPSDILALQPAHNKRAA